MSTVSLNVGTTDRLIRLSLGLALLIAAFVLRGSFGSTGFIVAMVVGAVLVVTASVRFCPAYALFRMNTTGRSGK